MQVRVPVRTDSRHGVLATSAAGTAVSAFTGVGTAVAAQVNEAGGTALRVSGRAVYSNCGAAVVKGSTGTPKNSVVATEAVPTTDSIVVATLQTSVVGVYVASAVPHATSSKITITLNQAVTQHVTIGWFVIDLIPQGGTG